MRLMVVTRDGVRQAEPEQGPDNSTTADSAPMAAEVHAEAARRIKATGYEQQALREFATGAPMRPEVKYLVMQIRFAAEALASLSPIPSDFRHDRYWPN